MCGAHTPATGWLLPPPSLPPLPPHSLSPSVHPSSYLCSLPCLLRPLQRKGVVSLFALLLLSFWFELCFPPLKKKKPTKFSLVIFILFYFACLHPSSRCSIFLQSQLLTLSSCILLIPLPTFPASLISPQKKWTTPARTTKKSLSRCNCLRARLPFCDLPFFPP